MEGLTSTRTVAWAVGMVLVWIRPGAVTITDMESRLSCRVELLLGHTSQSQGYFPFGMQLSIRFLP